jgi:AcrR family transcriptional regulator
MAQRKYDSDERRRMLIRATANMLEEGGLRAVTMRALSARIGISHAAPYRHFRNKTALLAAVAEDGFDRLAERLEKLDGAWGGEPLERFRTSACGYVRFAVDNPELYRLMFGKESAGDGPIHRLAPPAHRILTILHKMIRDCQNHGLFRLNNPANQATFAWAAIHGLSLLMINGLADDPTASEECRPPRVSHRELTEITIGFLVRSFAEPPGDAGEAAPVPHPNVATQIREGDDRP